MNRFCLAFGISLNGLGMAGIIVNGILKSGGSAMGASITTMLLGSILIAYAFPKKP